MWKVFYGTYAFFGKMLNLSSVVFVVGGGGDCVMFTGSRLLLLLLVDYICDAHRFIKITSYKIKVYIHNKNI